MLKQLTLTVEQMKELQALGVDCSDASMFLFPVYEDGKFSFYLNGVCSDEKTVERWKETIPDKSKDFHHAYTLQDIIEKLPKKIGGTPLHLDREFYGNWVCGYFEKYQSAESIISIASNSPLAAAFEILKWYYSEGIKM